MNIFNMSFEIVGGLLHYISKIYETTLVTYTDLNCDLSTVLTLKMCNFRALLGTEMTVCVCVH